MMPRSAASHALALPVLPTKAGSRQGAPRRAAAALGLGAVALAALAALSGAASGKLPFPIDFGFLWSPAGFPIVDSVLPFSPEDSYFRALLTGWTNTVFVSLLSCMLAILIGVLLGVLAESRVAIIRQFIAGYRLLFRNTPILLQLLFWYALLQRLPPLRQSLDLSGLVLLSQKGLAIPAPFTERPASLGLAALLALLLLVAGWRGTRRFDDAPVLKARLRGGLLLGCLLMAAIGIALSGPQWSMPAIVGFGYRGGAVVTPEFAATLLTLTLYSGAFIAESVRGGIASIPVGQWDAGHSLGLTRWQAMRLIVLPQIVKLVAPPVISQCVSTVKNSGIAVAIGYPELLLATTAAISHSGRAIECFSLLMIGYLIPSLALGALLERLQKRAALPSAPGKLP